MGRGYEEATDMLGKRIDDDYHHYDKDDDNDDDYDDHHHNHMMTIAITMKEMTMTLNCGVEAMTFEVQRWC